MQRRIFLVSTVYWSLGLHAALAKSTPLVEWHVVGGMGVAVPKNSPPRRVDSMPHFILRVYPDGKLDWSDTERGAKWSTGHLTPFELADLNKAIDASHLDTLQQEPRSPRPSAADGLDQTVVWHGVRGPVKVDVWRVHDGDHLPIVTQLESLTHKYAH